MFARTLRRELPMNSRIRPIFAVAALLCAYLAFPRSAALAQDDHTIAAMERQFQEALAAQDKGDLDRAESLLRSLHVHHSQIFQVNETLGLLLVSRGDFSGALPLLQAAVREQPASDVAHANLGAAYYQLQRNTPAAEEFERAVQINPHNVLAQESLGRVSIENHKPDIAARALLAAHKLRPDDADLKLDCITALLDANRLGEAEIMLSTVVSADQSARALSLLGEADEKAGRFKEAGQHFARAVALEPSEENAWQLAVELLRHWTFDAAIEVFKAASAKFPDSKRMRLGLGAALFGDSEFAHALPVFADLLRTEPNNAMYAELLGMSCTAPLSATDPRCDALVAYAQAHPADARAATYAAGSLLVGNGNEPNVALARQLLVRAIAVDPKLAEADLQMGVALQQSNDLEHSIPYLEQAIKLKPELTQARYRLARAYWKMGRRKDGEVQMELQKKYARQEAEDLDRSLSQIVTFGVEVKQ